MRSAETRSHRPLPRLILCLLIGLLAGHYAHWVAYTSSFPRDFGQVWFAAGAVVRGQDPYALIGPGRAFQWPAPLFYPLPAAIAAIPFAGFPYAIAMAAFVTVGVGAFAWALTENGRAPLLALASSCFTHAVFVAQWSPLLAGALVVTPLSAVLIAKPTVGAALFVARPSWWAVGGGLALILVAFVVQPGWVAEWRDALRPASVGTGKAFPYTAPITFPGGAIVLLALSRWRRWEARLLVALACVPQTLLPYEAVYLFLIPRGWIECAGLLVLSHLMTWGWVRLSYDQVDMATLIAVNGAAITMFLYVPATLMVLRRPNAGALPTWLEARIASWPAWLRGRRVDGAIA